MCILNNDSKRFFAQLRSAGASRRSGHRSRTVRETFISHGSSYDEPLSWAPGAVHFVMAVSMEKRQVVSAVVPSRPEGTRIDMVDFHAKTFQVLAWKVC